MLAVLHSAFYVNHCFSSCFQLLYVSQALITINRLCYQFCFEQYLFLFQTACKYLQGYIDSYKEDLGSLPASGKYYHIFKILSVGLDFTLQTRHQLYITLLASNLVQFLSRLCCNVTVRSKYLIRLLRQFWNTGCHIMHPPVEILPHPSPP